MKRCPKCQNTYTDDSLGFCLQDGTSLFNVKDLLASAETLEMRIEPTQSTQVPVPTTSREASAPRPDSAAAAGTSKALLGGVFLIAVLLLALVCITGAVLLRGVVWDKPAANAQPNANATPSAADKPVKITASASSTREPMGGNFYYPSNVIDQNLGSAWIEGVDGPGRGSWVQCDFDREVALSSIKIYPGYFKSPPLWAENNRVAVATLSFSDGSSMHVNFPDQMQPQEVATAGVRTRWVKLTIDDIYPGTKDFMDTAISELQFTFK